MKLPKISTFILITDPQVSWIPPARQLPALSNLNKALNNIHAISFPDNDKKIGIDLLHCNGTYIGKPEAVFFAGDLTNYGGHMNIGEWFSGKEVLGVGGDILKDFRRLYDPKFIDSRFSIPIEKLSNCGPLYFGLGNHDLLDFDTCFFQWPFWDGHVNTSCTDYYRYQMWNFINTMHTGYHQKNRQLDPSYPVPPEDIDSDPLGTYWFKDNSFNYVVRLGPVDVYQLHMYGGDSHWDGPPGDHYDRKSGLDWLKRKLAAGGYTRPVIIIQHFPNLIPTFSDVIRPYNVLAVGVGHFHGPVKVVEIPRSNISGVQNDNHMYKIHPGGALIDDKYPDFLSNTTGARFAVVRLEESPSGNEILLNVLYGTVKEPKSEIQWQHGWHNSAPLEQLYVQDIEVMYQDHAANDADTNLPWYVTEEFGKSANINDGFNGTFVYLKPTLTNNITDAITGFDLLIQDHPYNGPNTKIKNLADGLQGQYRYLVPKSEAGKRPIKQLFLWRPDGIQAPRIGWKMTGDINKGRGNELVLEWETKGTGPCGTTKRCVD